jgi:hypothetical protein
MIIIRALRKWKLFKKILIIQRNIRMFIGKRRAHRARLAILAEERSRFTREQLEIKSAVIEFCKTDKSWFIGLLASSSQYSNDKAKHNLNDIDSKSFQRSRNLIYSLDQMVSEILQCKYTCLNKYGIELSALTYRQRVAVAILCLYSNRPNACLDFNALDLCLKYFTLIPKTTDDSNQSLESLFNERTIPHSVDISHLIKFLQPHRSIVWRSRLLGHLSEESVVTAAILRNWSSQLDLALKTCVKDFRNKFKVKNYCRDCLEPLIWPHQVKEHGNDICIRNSSISWVNKENLKLAQSSLVVACNSIDGDFKTDRSSAEYIQCRAFQI